MIASTFSSRCGPRTRARESTTKVFLQNIKVLAVGQEVETATRARLHATPATVATLLVSPQDAERLVLAQTEGRIMLTLRSWTDSLAGGDGRRQPVRARRRRPGRAERGARRAASPAARAVAARRGRGGKDKGPTGRRPPSPPRQPQKDTVEILRGDRFEQRNFNRGEKR